MVSRSAYAIQMRILYFLYGLEKCLCYTNADIIGYPSTSTFILNTNMNADNEKINSNVSTLQEIC